MQPQHQFDPPGIDPCQVVEKENAGIVDEHLDVKLLVFAIAIQVFGCIFGRQVPVQGRDSDTLLLPYCGGGVRDAFGVVADD